MTGRVELEAGLGEPALGIRPEEFDVKAGGEAWELGKLSEGPPVAVSVTLLRGAFAVLETAA